MKKFKVILVILSSFMLLNGCSTFDWLVYKPDIPQGNYIEEEQVDKLRIDMTMEQVEYLLGRPVLRDSFADNTWYYVYHYKSGKNAKVTHKELQIFFDDNTYKIKSVKGDYNLNSDFNTPLEESKLELKNVANSAPLNPEIRPDAKELVEETTGNQKKDILNREISN